VGCNTDSVMPNYPRGMFLYDERLVMLRYEKNTMVLPREEYEERGYEPKIVDLPSRGDWLRQYDSDGEYIAPIRPGRPRNRSGARIIRNATGQRPIRPFTAVFRCGLIASVWPRAGHLLIWCRLQTSGTNQTARRVQFCRVMNPSKNVASGPRPSSGRTCATYWSGRTITMHPRSRSIPRMVKISLPLFRSAQNIFS
jgi:hypothetical protein